MHAHNSYTRFYNKREGQCNNRDEEGLFLSRARYVYTEQQQQQQHGKGKDRGKGAK
jgi:hypothetical protein